MRVAVVGLGYAGLVSAVCLAREGHSVIGVDTNPRTATEIGSGRASLCEAQVADLLEEQVAAGRLRVAETAVAVRASDLTLICVGTPADRCGDADLSHVELVCRGVAKALQGRPGHLVVLRSTVPPGTTEEMAEVMARHSGLELGKDLLVAFHPEFLREGTSVEDFDRPPYTVVGTAHAEAADRLRALYGFLTAPFLLLEPREAELLKYASNAFHATKVAFANEIGRVAAAHGINGRRVMGTLCRDSELNLSAAYLRPGLPFGGACLPKDLSALVAEARDLGVEVPLLEGICTSNAIQLDKAQELVEEAISRNPGPIGILGLSFKEGTEDVRESAAAVLADRLIRAGHEVRVFDENVQLERLSGSNKEFLLERAATVAGALVESVDAVSAECRTIVVNNQYARGAGMIRLAASNATILDLSRLLSGSADSPDDVSEPRLDASAGYTSP